MSEHTHEFATLDAMVKRLFPDGEINQLGFPAEMAIIVDRGNGSRIYDVTGREYIDFMMGMGPLILGHAHPSIIQSVTQQLQRGTTYYTASEPSIRLADELVQACPCAERIRFTISGTEATSGAIRFAKAIKRRQKILKFEGAFHGSHDMALMSMAPALPGCLPMCSSLHSTTLKQPPSSSSHSLRN
jgi:glutamate-1-semialdehyde 2,1-aminomutase